VNRIFTSLALFSVAFLFAAFLLGLSLQGDKLRDRMDQQAQQRGTVHRLSGIAAGLTVLLVDSIVVTYFIGTSRWCKEVVETYGLDRMFIRRSTKLKRRTFPVAVVSMLIAVGIVALGGAADPGAIMPTPAVSLHMALLDGVGWNTLHLIGAALGIMAICLGFLIEWNKIRANHEIISEVLAEVRRIRTERGLPN
jgi:hypothetical protein